MPSRGPFLLMWVLLLAAVSAALARPADQVHKNTPNMQESSAPSTTDVSRAIASAVGYVEHACDQDGKFVYRVNLDTGEEAANYNIIRHAGAMYALATLNRLHPDEQAVEVMLRAASFLRRRYIGPGVRPDQLVVWSAPLPRHSDAELGGTGLGLLALAAVYELDPKSIPLEELEALGRFLLFLQKDDGSFVSKYRADSGPAPDFESLYYPGEAALGLIALYEADHSQLWLDAAAKALSYLAKNRAALSTVPADHWALIATAKLLPYCEQTACPVSREELLQHAIQVCSSILREQIVNPTHPVLDGAFDPTGRTAPAATRLEGLLAALEFLPRESGELRTQIETATTRGVAFLLRAQIASGPYAGGVPGAIAAGAKDSSALRIDYVQHALCAWLRYQQLFQKNQAAARAIIGRDSGHVRLLIGGDVDLGESYQDEYAREGAGNVLVEKGYDYGVANLRQLLQAVDYRILNLETPLTLHHDSRLKDKDYLHYSDPVKAPLVFACFGPVAYSLANNHTLDQGEVGLHDTIASLKTAGAHYFGAGKDLPDASNPFIQEFLLGGRALTVAVFGGLEYSKRYEEQFEFYATSNRAGVARIDVPALEKAISDLRRQATHLYVIYFMHTLENYKWKSPEQAATAHALKDAGVDLVVGSGAHMMQEVEYDGDQWIFYGVGNFLFNAGGRYAGNHAPPYSLPLVVDFSMEDDRLQTNLRVYPIVSDNKLTNYQPRFVTETELRVVDALLADKSRWNEADRAAVKSGRDGIGRYLEFSDPGGPKASN
jgi:poly-gamma-glutamate capsule biosynthesis protein CapA/YwtB (metallophosphatase superfamily)